MLTEDVSRAVYDVPSENAESKLCDEISDYFGIKKDVARERLYHSGLIFLGAWLHADPQTDSEVHDFYVKTPTNIYCATWYALNVQLKVAPAIRDQLKELDAHRILDFGGGGGELAMYLRSCGFDVTYADLGKTAEFAAWRFARRGICDIEAINLARANEEMRKLDAGIPTMLGERVFDVITCFDTIEHIPNIESTIKELRRHLREGSVLLINFPNNCGDERQPFHLAMNKVIYDTWGKSMNKLGFEAFKGGFIYDGKTL